MGHIVSFKNTKMIARRRLITDPRKRALMDQYTRVIESALSSALATTVAVTLTGLSQPCSIASLAPLDDSLDWIPESDGYRTEHVAKGEEGIDIIIERLP
jgi:hypothetical protein